MFNFSVSDYVKTYRDTDGDNETGLISVDKGIRQRLAAVGASPLPFRL